MELERVRLCTRQGGEWGVGVGTGRSSSAPLTALPSPAPVWPLLVGLVLFHRWPDVDSCLGLTKMRIWALGCQLCLLDTWDTARRAY